MSESEKEAIVNYLKEHLRLELINVSHIVVNYSSMANEKHISVIANLFFDSELITSGVTQIII